jgi:radical SAM protein with 4Fe4S-binding SPASM domain
MRLIDYLVDNGFMAVTFEGGEPLHRQDFMAVLRYSARKLLTWFRTNATLVTPQVARDVKQAGVATVIVDLLSPDPDTHDYLTGVPGSQRRTLQGLSHLASAGVPVIMALILNRLNAGQLQRYVELAAQLSVARVGILRMYPIGRARRNWPELSLSLPEMMEALESIRPPEGVRVMQSWHPRDPNCCWENAGINAFGDSVGCPYLREFVNYGNIRTVPFLETWDHPLYKQLRAGGIADSCPQCEESEGSGGGCRAAAYAFTGSWDAPDPYCTSMNKGTDLRVLPDWLLQKDRRAAHQSRR